MRSAGPTSTRCSSRIAFDGKAAVLDARDVDEARPLGEQFLLAGQVVVEGVVKQLEPVTGPDIVDRVHGRPLGPQRAFGEAQRLDQAHDPVPLEYRLQALKGRPQSPPPARWPTGRPRPS